MLKFSETVIETITIKNLKLTSNMVNVNEFFLKNLHDVLHTVENVLKYAIQW